MLQRYEIKSRARGRYQNQYYWTIVLSGGLYLLILYLMSGSFFPRDVNYTVTYSGFSVQTAQNMGVLGVVCFLLCLLVGTVLVTGLCSYYLRIWRGDFVQLTTPLQAFYDYGRRLGGMLYMALFLFLWTLLFVIPGIVKAYSYFCTPYILADCKNVPPTKALELSKKMMYGNKGKVFVAQLSFLGWILLMALVAGVAAGVVGWMSGSAASVVGAVVVFAVEVLFLFPYTQLTMAGYYDEIKRDALARGVVSPADFE